LQRGRSGEYAAPGDFFEIALGALGDVFQ
jgi:hypothetical protein